MTLAEVEYPEDYRYAHSKIVTLMKACFSNVEFGLQGDSWIWVMDGDDKVTIDTFTCMKHQVKSNSAGVHVQKVIDALRVKYNVRVFDDPLEE